MGPPLRRAKNSTDKRRRSRKLDCCGPVWPVSFPKPQFATTSSDWATVSAILPRAAPQRLAPSLTRLIPTSLLPASGLDHLLCTSKLVRRPAQRHRSLRIEREHALHLSLAPDLVYRLQKALRRRRVHVSHLRHLAAGSARLELLRALAARTVQLLQQPVRQRNAWRRGGWNWWRGSCWP